jgi:hypothetical protein
LRGGFEVGTDMRNQKDEEKPKHSRFLEKMT